RRTRLVDGQRGKPVALRSLRDELDLPRWRVERERRIGDVRDVLRMDASGVADPGDRRVARSGVREHGVRHAAARPTAGGGWATCETFCGWMPPASRIRATVAWPVAA